MMSTPFNKPTIKEPAVGTLSLSLPTYERFANFAGLKPGSIGDGDAHGGNPVMNFVSLSMQIM